MAMDKETPGGRPTGSTVDAFLSWAALSSAATQPGRYGVSCGTVHEMTAERARHADVKFAVQAE